MLVKKNTSFAKSDIAELEDDFRYVNFWILLWVRLQFGVTFCCQRDNFKGCVYLLCNRWSGSH